MSRFGADVLQRALAAVKAAQERETAPHAAAPPPAAQNAPSGPPDAPDEALQLAAALCRRWEGLHLRPYLCPAGIPTVGYGSTQYPDGLAVRLADQPITEATANAMLLHDLRSVRLPAVRRLCPDVRDPARLAALVSFAYNVGNGALAASTLRRRVNAGRWDQVPAELRRWVYAAGRRLLGLVRRREDEASLIRP